MLGSEVNETYSIVLLFISYMKAINNHGVQKNVYKQWVW